MAKDRSVIEQLIRRDLDALLGRSFAPGPLEDARAVEFLLEGVDESDEVSGLLVASFRDGRMHYGLRWLYRGVHAGVANGRSDPDDPVGPTNNSVEIDGTTILEFANDAADEPM